MFSPPPLPTFSNPFADAAGGAATKLILTPESGSAFTFKFNPSQFSLDRAVSWEDTKPMKEQYGILNFTGGSSDTLTFASMLDATEDSGGVLPDVEKLYAFTKASVTDGAYKRPPVMLLEWSKLKFSGVISAVKVDFTMFAPDGTPLRCDVTITMMGRSFQNQTAKDKFFAAFSTT
jgi:hypothetical protein